MVDLKKSDISTEDQPPKEISIGQLVQECKAGLQNISKNIITALKNGSDLIIKKEHINIVDSTLGKIDQFQKRYGDLLQHQQTKLEKLNTAFSQHSLQLEKVKERLVQKFSSEDSVSTKQLLETLEQKTKELDALFKELSEFKKTKIV